MMFELNLEGQRRINQKKTGSEIEDGRRPLQKAGILCAETQVGNGMVRVCPVGACMRGRGSGDVGPKAGEKGGQGRLQVWTVP